MEITRSAKSEGRCTFTVPLPLGETNVDAALYKLGLHAENIESHSNVFIIGNESTGLWKKARGLSKAEEIFPLIEEVLNDKLPLGN